MNPKYLEQFLRVAEMGSINKAAHDLKISQPSMSRNISLLEHEMGAELFVRSRNGVTLTEAGKLLVDHCRPLLRQFSLLREQIGKMARGQVAAGIPPSWRSILTVEFAETMARDDDEIEIRLMENVSHALREQLSVGSIDLCIAPAEKGNSDNFKQTPIVEEPLVLVGGNSAGLSADMPVPISELARRTLIIPPRPNAIRSMFEQACASRNIDLNVAIETDTLSLCLEMCSRDVGYSVMPRCAILSNPQFSDVAWAPIDGLSVTWALFENPRRTHSQAVRKCRRLMMSIVNDVVASGRWTGARRV